MKHLEIKKKLDAALADYRENPKNLTVKEAEEKTAAIKKLREDLSAAIAEGALCCPKCGKLPMGMEQPDGFEIGCISCGWFRHTDGTIRDHGARVASPLPKHAVEAWNEGPDFWKKKTDDKFLADYGKKKLDALKPSQASAISKEERVALTQKGQP